MGIQKLYTEDEVHSLIMRAIAWSRLADESTTAKQLQEFVYMLLNEKK